MEWKSDSCFFDAFAQGLPYIITSQNFLAFMGVNGKKISTPLRFALRYSDMFILVLIGAYDAPYAYLLRGIGVCGAPNRELHFR